MGLPTGTVTFLFTEMLGDDRVRALRAQGAAMDADEAVVFTLARLDAFIRAQPLLP